jgi:hypothetical protein
VFSDLKENMNTMRENTLYKKEQMKPLELKNTVSGMKISLDRISNNLDIEKEKLCEFEHSKRSHPSKGRKVTAKKNE